MKQKILLTTIFLTFFITMFFIARTIFCSEKKQNIDAGVKIYKVDCEKYDKGEVKIGSKIIFVDIADDVCKKELGLSSRSFLDDDTGMIFVFDEVGIYGFWMKDMNFSLDILWIDGDFKVNGIEKDIATSTYPKQFGEKYLARYVLEVPAGYSDKNNVKVGDKIIFSKNNL